LFPLLLTGTPNLVHMSDIDSSDALRLPAAVPLPDPRMAIGSPSANLTRRHAAIAAVQLSDAVPERIRIHFETARNAYLYAWCVYRFHMVAEHYVFSTLELALRERLNELGLVPTGKRQPRGLGDWIRLAAKHSVITNGRFRPGEAIARQRAEDRLSDQMRRKMLAEGLDEIEYSLADAKVQPEDYLDWVDHYAVHMPKIRNLHAHGTDMLYPTVLHSFVVVADFINQCYAPLSAPEGGGPLADAK
jgi:hypothetical protein